jgi:hypothetical protein
MGEEKCMNITVQVVAPPAVETEPMSLTLEKVTMTFTKWRFLAYTVSDLVKSFHLCSFHIQILFEVVSLNYRLLRSLV